MIRKGSWIEIEVEVLKAEERAANIPLETRREPLKLWTKGFALRDCCLGEEVEVETVTGRKLKGTAIQEKPRFNHDFGDFVEEVLYIGLQAKEILNEG